MVSTFGVITKSVKRRDGTCVIMHCAIYQGIDFGLNTPMISGKRFDSDEV